MMDGFRIEKNIPVPPARGNPIYPWKHMDIGDSFLVEKANATNLHYAAKRSGIKIRIRKTDFGIRVWRVA
jgi:hypothetical protein